MWKTKIKTLSITDVQDHVHADTNVCGVGPPTIKTIQFAPLALYGAAARCSNLNAVNPHAATHESNMIAALVEQYVDDTSADFALLKSVDNFKDFGRSYFAGTVAAGIAYLVMIKNGYVWADHFESFKGGGNAASKKSPDFVFAGHGPGVALTESKGSRRKHLSAFDTTVKLGYIHQVAPHLGYALGQVCATHGYCIGAYLKSPSKAELRVHHTAALAGARVTAQRTLLGPVQRQNYATAFQLAHGSNLGQEIRQGEKPEQVDFLQFDWRGHSWVTGTIPCSDYPHDIQVVPGGLGRRLLFAVEKGVAESVLRRFLGRSLQDDLEVDDVPLFESSIVGIERQEAGGIAYPDGSAVLSHQAPLEKLDFIHWRSDGAGYFK